MNTGQYSLRVAREYWRSRVRSGIKVGSLLRGKPMTQPQAVPNEAGNTQKISPLSGLPAPKELLVDLVQLERCYYERKPDMDDPQQLVSFGTSGHRGSSLMGTFTEAHILA